VSDPDVITAEIRASYERDARLPHPKEVAIDVRDGTVTLRGTVESFRQRKAAVELARSVSGVHDVEDELVVDLDPRDRHTDEELRGAALQALMSSDDVPDDRIDVSVSAAWVTLKGEVKHQEQSDAAFEAISGLEGIGGITNKIAVVSPSGR
jgi:osmotically-inducible protein OsmY